MIDKKRILELVVILFIGFTPLLWFRNSEIILGHDAGLTLSPVSHFTDRLYAWTDRFGFGNDQTYAIPGFFIHGLEALIGVFTNDIQLVQKITFIFWFLLPGIAMYYFASKLAKKYNLTFFALPVSVLYMFNHFLLQGWFVAERTKFSLYAGLPLILGLLFEWQEKKQSTLIVSILISLILFVLNGQGSLPLFGGLIVSVLAFLIFYLYQDFTKEKIRKILYLFAGIGFFSFLLNSYWLLPFIYFVSHSFSAVVTQAGGVGGVLGWLNYVSQDSSLINLFRLQGIPEWYQNPFHPYANNFLNNPLLVIVGFLIPVLAFLPLLLYKEKQARKLILFFSFLGLLSMIFIAGSHPPFGAIYVFLVNFVPGFIAFRTPFYKFSPALWFAYSVLIGLSINYFLEKLHVKKKVAPYILYGFSCVAIVFYSYPFLTGSFFDYIKNLRSMRVTVPEYVYEYGKWSESENRINVRTLALPPPSSAMKVDAYTWGYWSLAPLTSLLTNASIINNTGYMTESETKLLEILYRKMKHNEPGWENLAKLLHIHSFLLRNDFAWNLRETPTDNPILYKKILSNANLHMVKEFGKWEVYDFNDSDSVDRISSVDTIYYLEGDIEDIGNIASLPAFNPKSAMYTSNTPSTDSKEVLNRSTAIFISPRCIMCTLIPQFVNEDLFIPTFTPDSYLYQLIQLREKSSLVSSQEPPAVQVEYFLTKSLKDQKGAERVIDEKKSSESVEKAVKQYASTMEKLHEALSKLTQDNNLNNNDLLVKAYAYIRIERKNFIEKFSEADENIDPTIINTLFDNIEKSFTIVKNNAWYTSDLVNKKYVLSSPKTDSYTLLIKETSISDPRDFDSKTISLSFDDKNVTVKPQAMGNGWSSLGIFNLSEGLHTINFSDSPQLNLYTASDSVNIVSSIGKGHECFKAPIISSESGDIFNISMDYRHRQGPAEFFFFPLQKFDSLSLLSNKGLNFKRSANLEKLSTVYTATNNDGFYFMICSRIESEAPKIESILEAANIVINKMTSPELLLINSKVPSEDYTDILTIDKKTSTDYTVKTSNSFQNKILLFNLSYSPNWILSGSSSDNFLANGFSKAWMLKEDTKEIEIKYTTQSLVKIGFALTFVSLVSLLALIVVLRLKKYDEKN